MTPDLQMLVYAVVLLLLQILPYFIAYQVHWKQSDIMGARLDVPPLPEWAQRAQRAEANMVTNLSHFAILVLVAHVTGSANETTALGAELFLYARIAYALIYIMGIPGLRSIAWIAGLAGEVMILLQLF